MIQASKFAAAALTVALPLFLTPTAACTHQAAQAASAHRHSHSHGGIDANPSPNANLSANPGPSAPRTTGEGASTYDSWLTVAHAHLRGRRFEQAANAAKQGARVAPQKHEAYTLWGRALAHQGQLKAAATRYEAARTRGSRDAQLFKELASIYDVTKQYQAAHDVYQDYAKDRPGDPDMLQQWGLTLLLLGDASLAVEKLQAARAAKPGDLELLQDLGYALWQAGELNQARMRLEQVVQQQPKGVDAMIFLARIRAAQGHNEAAREWVVKGLALDPSNTQLQQLAQALKRAGRPGP